MLAFGVSAKELDLNVALKKNEIGKIDGTGILFTDAIDDLNADPNLKRPFWNALQKMFGLK